MLKQLIQFCQRLLTEVAELEQICLVKLHQIAESLHTRCLEAVECTNGEVHIDEFCLKQLAHTKYLLVKLLIALEVVVLERDLLIGKEHEVVDEDFGSLLQSVLRMNRTVGGDFELSAILAKKALTRSLDVRSDLPHIKALEDELLKEINELGIGPAGLGGSTTALAVNVETYPTHIAGMPVAVNMCCHVNRHARVIL